VCVLRDAWAVRTRKLDVVLLACASLLAACPTDPADEVGDSATETGDGDGDGDGEPGDGDGDGEAPFDYCDGLPPDALCYADKREPDSQAVALAMAIADRHMATHPPTEQTWDWEAAVLMFGLTELHRVTGEPRFQD